MLPTFASLIQRSRTTDIRIAVYYTRASNSEDPNKVYGYLPPNITLAAGRPRLSTILDDLVDQTCSVAPQRSGFVVGVCGPGGLGEQVRKIVGELDGDRRASVGGIELCEECVSLLVSRTKCLMD